VAVAARLAGEGAQECGVADPWADDELVLKARRDCALAAAAKGRPFFATVSPPSADGGIEVAWAFDGAVFYRVEHVYAIGQMGGCDSESSSYTACERLEVDAADCGALWDDLCFRCGAPSERVAACH